MAQAYPVRLYFNTGFNRGNVPGAASILDAFNHVDADAVYKFQSRGLATVRLKMTFESVKNADYCRIGNEGAFSYYIIDNIIMYNDVTAELSLILDPLLTAGGLAALTVISGWTKRAHAGSDTIFSNILPEPWAPSQNLVMRNKTTVHDVETMENSGLNYQFIVSTVDLTKMENLTAKIAEASDGTTQGTVVWPELPAVTEGTTFRMPRSTNAYFYVATLPYQVLYAIVPLQTDVNNVILSGVSAARSLGIESAILDSYLIPYDDLDFSQPSGQQPGTVIQADGKCTWISGKKWNFSPGFGYNYKTTKNAKAVCLYNTYAITSLATGSSLAFAAQELYSGGDSPDFRGLVDPSPSGTVYLQPTYYEGKQTQRLEQAVAGGPWFRGSLQYQGASGSALTLMSAQRANVSIKMAQEYDNAAYVDKGAKMAIASIGDILGLGSAFKTGAASIPANALPAASPSAYSMASTIGNDAKDVFLASVGSAANLATTLAIDKPALFRAAEYSWNTKDKQMGDNLFTANAAANLAAPEISFPFSVNSAAYFGNGFLISQVTLSDNDLARFDDFLTRFGYAQDKKFEASDLTNRTNFNYILTTDANLKAGNAPRSIVEQIEQMFNSGVRVWHVAPSSAAIADNPIAG